MKVKLCPVFLILFTLLIYPVYPQDSTKSGIVYGDNWAYVAQAPSGWIMDMDTLASDDIYGLFYEEGKIFGANCPSWTGTKKSAWHQNEPRHTQKP